ncbi:hypothetical protein ACH5RR_025555 [Cinchona calisaya]|uniref:Uncharacterized protein n=1 Tax=Cinchona calisaya TaxID=153742 RepID=A0ABD2Z4Z6_9GENT
MKIAWLKGVEVDGNGLEKWVEATEVPGIARALEEVEDGPDKEVRLGKVRSPNPQLTWRTSGIPAAFFISKPGWSLDNQAFFPTPNSKAKDIKYDPIDDILYEDIKGWQNIKAIIQERRQRKRWTTTEKEMGNKNNRLQPQFSISCPRLCY